MTKVVVVAAVLLGALCVWAAIGGFGALGELLLTATVLVVLIAAGNLMMGPRHPSAPKQDRVEDP